MKEIHQKHDLDNAMRRIIFAFVFIYILGFTHSIGFAAGGDRTGNGGDGISQVFEEGRDLAIKILEHMDDCSLPKFTDEDIKTWLINNKRDLIEDIKETKHNWDPPVPQVTCAWTMDHPRNEILFTGKECKKVRYTADLAAGLLIHEAAHHFGVTSNVFAEQIVRAAKHSYKNSNCPQDPFDPLSCTTIPNLRFPSPPPYKAALIGDETSYATLTLGGTFRLFSRNRVCGTNMMNLKMNCTPWANEEGLMRTFVNGRGEQIKYSVVGPIKLAFEAPNNEIMLESFGKRRCEIKPMTSFCKIADGPLEEDELYEERQGVRQKLMLSTVWNGKCVRQYARLSFKKPGANDWIETEHVVFWPY